MKKAILIGLLLTAAHAPLPALAEAPTAYNVLLAGGSASNAEEPTAYNVLLAGGSASNVIQIWLTPDGRSYVIDSIVPLEVGGSICEHSSGNPNELVCQAVQVGAFEVNADGGDDVVRLIKGVEIPVTMRGGP